MVLSAAGEALWATCWAAPEAAGWSLIDVPAVTRLVWLETSAEISTDHRLMAECRQLEDRFGMSPAARRRNANRAAPPEPPQPPPRPRVAAPADRRAAALRLLNDDNGGNCA